jgi:hypothetical protein
MLGWEAAAAALCVAEQGPPAMSYKSAGQAPWAWRGAFRRALNIVQE